MMLTKHQKNVHKGKRLWLLHQVLEEGIRKEPATADASDDATMPLSENLPSGNLNYCCHLCDFMADSMYQYRLHLPSHGQCGQLVRDISVDTPLKCGYCAYIAEDQKDFSAHINIHLNYRNYKCLFCEYSAYNRKDILSHLRYVHSDQDITNETNCIMSVKDAINQKTALGSMNHLPMLANLDPRVGLEDCMKLSNRDLTSSSTSPDTSVKHGDFLFRNEVLLSTTRIDPETSIGVNKTDVSQKGGFNKECQSSLDLGLEVSDTEVGDSVEDSLKSDSVDDDISCVSTSGIFKEMGSNDLGAFDSMDKALAELNKDSDQTSNEQSKNLFEHFQQELN